MKTALLLIAFFGTQIILGVYWSDIFGKDRIRTAEEIECDIASNLLDEAYEDASRLVNTKDYKIINARRKETIRRRLHNAIYQCDGEIHEEYRDTLIELLQEEKD